MRNLLFAFIGFLCTCCDKEKYFGGSNAYEDDFETYSNVDSTIDGDNIRWSYFQKTVDGNSVVLDSQIVHSGTKSLKFFASPSTSGASKASIAKQKMSFYEGDIVRAEMWYYIEGTTSADWLFLFDIEEQSAIGAGPGMRLAITNDQLVVEHKFFNPNIYQKAGEEKNIPRNTWFKITIETLLSQKDKGYVKIWQDDTLIIDQSDWVTLPKDMLYFQQGTKGMYTSIEFGITANTKENPMLLYLDDVSIKVLN